jgi:cytoskeletal protein CcmA (bactofilin family)
MNAAEGSTHIGKSVSIRGELIGSEDLVLDGKFDGSITLSDSHLNVRDVIVFGLVEGNIHASGRIELRQSAVVNGDLFAGRLSIEESASVRGRVELVGNAVPAAAEPQH